MTLAYTIMFGILLVIWAIELVINTRTIRSNKQNRELTESFNIRVDQLNEEHEMSVEKHSTYIKKLHSEIQFYERDSSRSIDFVSKLIDALKDSGGKSE